VQKHAGANRVTVRALLREDALVVEVVDDGLGGADRGGAGLRGLADRLEALGGTLAVDSPAGAGTRLLARIPVVL
jgi:signal transduction histidine kinase